MNETANHLGPRSATRVAVALAALLAMLALGGCTLLRDRSQDPPTVKEVDLTRFAGTWYEVARLPNRFQARCDRDVTATYELLPNAQVGVTNRCVAADGSEIVAKGIARRNESTQARLRVNFLPGWLQWVGIAQANYWVLALDDTYEAVLVGEPTRQYLWVLSRKRTLSPTIYDALVDIARRDGYQVNDLQRTRQAGG